MDFFITDQVTSKILQTAIDSMVTNSGRHFMTSGTEYSTAVARIGLQRIYTPLDILETEDQGKKRYTNNISEMNLTSSPHYQSIVYIYYELYSQMGLYILYTFIYAGILRQRVWDVYDKHSQRI